MHPVTVALVMAVLAAAHDHLAGLQPWREAQQPLRVLLDVGTQRR